MTADPLTLEGKPAPDVELTAVGAGGKSEQVKLSSFKGKKNVVLAFYPKAMTPG
ncbi:MAG: redoxin domain-containing protein [Planctomycetes bacterium]|nr:redoxin domain-containing protein [Planctomycetota bacterium]